MIFPELGDGWAPTVLNDQREVDFIKAAQKGLSDSRSYWIGGSISSEPGSIASLNEYNTDENSGN